MSAMAGYANDLQRVRALGIDAADIARVTGAARATVGSWMRATRRPGAAHRGRLLELVSIVDRGESTLPASETSARARGLIMRTPDDDTPLDALGDGRYKSVSRLVAELENDSFS